MSIEIMLNIKIPTNLLLIPSVALLTACGGGQNVDAALSQDELVDAALSQDELVDVAVSLLERSDPLFAAEGWSDPSLLPTDGGATYTGIIRVENDLDDPSAYYFYAIGELELIADFNEPGNISGTAQNFRNEDNVLFGGELDITNGSINRLADTSTEPTFVADIDGTLTTGICCPADTEDYLVNAQLSGDFIGDSQEFLDGGFFGTLSSRQGTQDIYAIFIAEK